MGRLKSTWIPRVLCLVSCSCLVGCALPAPTLSPLAAAQIQTAPQNLIGATPGILNAEFGQPTLRRVDGTAQVWLYHSSSCGLNLFLYPDAAGVPRVSMATTADGSPAIGDCPISLEQSHIDAVSNMPVSAALEPPAAS